MASSGFLCFFILITLCVCVKTTTVSTEYGALSGTAYTTSSGRTVSAFLGVPYAKPPIGDYRFIEPQPLERWEGIRPADDFSSKCVQYAYHNLTKYPIFGEEDCLYLNIFTPIVSTSSKLNVIFYIHGGAFMFGAGDLFNPDYILDDLDIVYVSVNYRLGPFGFLSTEDEVIPGNNGLKDQALALKWVKNNIEQFGGNRNKITIAGLSAGGASVHLHYFSPLSRKLFHQGISLSGSALCPWVITENSRSKAQILANSVGCPTNGSKRLLKCLQQKEAKQILLQMEQLFYPWFYNPFTPFGPVVEIHSTTAFLSKNPYELLKEGSVKDAPWLTSITTEEGLYPGAAFVTNNTLMQELNVNWNKIAPHLLDYNHTIPPQKLNEVSDKIRKFYLGDRGISPKNKNKLVSMIGDRLFVVDVERAARMQASVTKSPVYFYSFAYRGKYSFTDFLCRCKENLGAGHADDLIYLLKVKFPPSPLETEEDRAMVKTMVNIWTSYVQSGVPAVGSLWTPVPNTVNQGNLTYLLISSSTDIKLSSSADLGNRWFWDSLPLQELWNVVDKHKRDEL